MKNITIKHKSQNKVTAPTGRMDYSGPLSHYNLFDLAANLVMKHMGDLFKRVSVIEDISGKKSGILGQFDPKRTYHKLPTNISEYLMNANIPSEMKDQLSLLPANSLFKVLKNMGYTNAPSDILTGATIEVDINKTLATYANIKDPLEFNYLVVKELADTLVHEATHVKEKEETGNTNEVGPELAGSEMKKKIDSLEANNLKQMIKNRLGIKDFNPYQLNLDAQKSQTVGE